MRHLQTIFCGAALVGAAAAQVTQGIGPSPNSTIVLDFDNPFVASGPIANNAPEFQAAGITSVTLVGSWAPGGDSLTATSNVMGQGLISQNGMLHVATAPEPLDNAAAGAGFEIQLAGLHNEFQALFIDQVNHTYAVEFFNGATSLGSSQFTYSGSFPNPPHFWTGTGPFDRVLITFPNGVAGVGLDNFAFDGPGSIGTSYCGPAVANSTGNPGVMAASGSASVASNDLTLEASDLPQGAFAFFLTSDTQGFSPMPGGSQGNLCLGGSIGRYVGAGQIQNAGMTGSIALLVDLTDHPQPMGSTSVQAGETWNFQAWYRDTSPTGATSNFTDGYSILFGQ